MPLNPTFNSIVTKINSVVKSKQLSYLHDSVLSQKLFGIESNFVEENPLLVREYHEGDSFNRNTEIKIFTNDKGGKAGRAKWYITKRDVIKSGNQYLDKWKVVVSSANAGGQKRSNQIAILDNLSAFGRARVALKTFETQKEAENFYKYANTFLIRFAFLLTDESLTSVAKRVPDLLNYTDDNGIIDFNGKVDSQLYELFKINNIEKGFIEETIMKKGY